MTKGELKLVLDVLPAMCQHYRENKGSLLAKIFGVFTLKTDTTQEVHLMLMENTLQLKNPAGLEYIFDLKGSLVDRKTKGKITSSTTLKDTNFLLASENSKKFINLTSARKNKILQVIKKDVDFLASRGLMDYSLLLGIECL